ncbi:MAG TPA: hypothetical protein VLM79_18590, partial [Kofleriaceae bacterium]|nr:hypothetical protein [Kofleriaceae bacterium]
RCNEPERILVLFERAHELGHAIAPADDAAEARRRVRDRGHVQRRIIWPLRHRFTRAAIRRIERLLCA